MSFERSDAGTVVTFYSYKGGTGRSMALANTAWILAASGLHVLAVDWDLESPGLHRYFHPFLVDRSLATTRGVLDLVRDFAAAGLERGPEGDDAVAEQARLARYAVSLEHDFAGGGTLDFVPAGRQDAGYGSRVSTFDWDSLYRRQGGGRLVEALRADMKAAYDYVLIDSRTGLSDTAGICTVALPDVVVDCFTLNTQSIDGAAAVAAQIRDLAGPDRRVRVLPVPMRVEDGEQTKLEAGRDYARARFRGLLADLDHEDRERYWGDVEIPYKPYYAYEEILATFGDRPRQENTLLAAYERLTAVVTGGRVRELVPPEEALRRRLLAEFERPRAAIPSDVFVSYAEQDRTWAEWLGAVLAAEGYRVVLQRGNLAPGADLSRETARALTGTACTVVLLSPDYLESPSAAASWEAAFATRPRGERRELLPVRIAEFRPWGSFAGRVALDLVGLEPGRARDELLAALRELGLAPSGSAPGTRPTDPGAPAFPGSGPAVSNLPARNPAFVGRDDLLLGLRDRLRASSRARGAAVVLHGLGGVGKTQVALEYAHRFASDYELVWWSQADQPGEVRASLAQLGREVGLLAGGEVGENVRVVLEALRRDRNRRPWLLIYDNAEEPTDLAGLTPTGPGHLLLTSGNRVWSTSGAEVVEVDVLSRPESVELIRRRGGDISDPRADLLAERLGDLPLALEQAAVWHAETGMPVDEYVGLLDERLGELLSLGSATHTRTVAATWGLAFERLREQAPGAAQLLELAAFFGPAPIPVRLLERGGSVSSLPDPLRAILTDRLGRLAALRVVNRYGLARLDAERETLQVHRLVQDFLRDRLSGPERERYRRGVHEILVAASPGNPDDPASWDRYAAASPHIVPSGALAGDAAVRRVVLEQIRYQSVRGDFESGRDLAESARARWLEELGPDDVDTLFASQYLADALRWLGEIVRPRELNQDALDRMRRIWGEDDERTLYTANSRAADLRIEGRFGEARALDEDNLARFRRLLGEDAPDTLRAMNNLAVDLRLLGDFRAARDLDVEIGRRQEQRGGGVVSQALITLSGISQDLVGLGEFAAARDLIAARLVPFRDRLGELHPDVLRVHRTWEIALRGAGGYAEALRVGERTLDRSGRRLGERHLDTLAAQMTVATDRRLNGDLAGARDLGRLSLSEHRDLLGDAHPFTQVAAVNWAITLRRVGELDAARDLDTTACAVLRECLGDAHPFTVAALAGMAGDLALAGDGSAAARRSEEVAALARRVYGADHPETVAAEVNLALDRTTAGDRPSPPGEAAGRLARMLGPEHPLVVVARTGGRIEFGSEPPSF